MSMRDVLDVGRSRGELLVADAVGWATGLPEPHPPPTSAKTKTTTSHARRIGRRYQHSSFQAVPSTMPRALQRTGVK
jgi:hypothetical protein